MRMEAASAPINPGLFAALAAREVAQPAGASGQEPTQGLRPRLPNPCETFDLNRDNPPLEEQVETSAPAPSPQSAIAESGLGAHRLQPLVSDPVGEHPSRPAKRFQPRRHTRYGEAEFSRDERQDDDQTRDRRPLASGIFGTPGPDKPSPGSIESFRPEMAHTQSQRPQPLVPEQTITERMNTFEREIIHEIRPAGLFAQTADRSAGVSPRLVPAHALIPPAVKSPEPSIEIHIGRIEVRAQVQATPAKQEKTPAASTDNRSLQAYLLNRSRGARS
ncbi:MAG: hypothetical protein ACRERU_00365 [Methylococcales bacterium]